MRAHRIAAALASLLAVACVPKRVPHSPDPATARRFEIVSATDTTFRFVAPGVRWVRIGQSGIAVDPRRRDALVARYVVTGRSGDTATAIVTGQTTDVSPAHVALLDAPRPGMLRHRSFWLGFLSGGALAGATALVTR